MIRISLFLALLWLAVPSANALDLGGQVFDKLEAPIAGAKICFQSNQTHCAFSDDSGRFRISLPAAVRKAASKRSLKIGLEGRGISIQSPESMRLILELFDARGRLVYRALPVIAEGLTYVSLAPASARDPDAGIFFLKVKAEGETSVYRVVFLHGSPAKVSSAAGPSALAKVSAMRTFRAIATKPGFRRTEGVLYESMGLTYIGMAAEGDSGYFRTSSFGFGITGLDTIEHVIRINSSYFRCNGSVRTLQESTGSIPVRILDGKLFMALTSSCQAMRFGGGHDIVGSWNLEDYAVELPAGIRPDTCPPPQPDSRPVESPAHTELQISASAMTFTAYRETCPGDGAYYVLLTHMRSYSTAKMISNTCRRTVYRNAGGEEASVTYEPFGGQDTARVSFTYKDKKCSYIDPLLNGTPSSTCPNPIEGLQKDYLTCVDESGFTGHP